MRFYESARQSLPIREALLYGSHAKGSARHDSDVAVVDESDHSKRVEITAGLFGSAFAIEPAIKPKSTFRDEYQDHDKDSILAEIINTAVEIVQRRRVDVGAQGPARDKRRP